MNKLHNIRFLSALLILIPFLGESQHKDLKIRLKVLQRGQIGKELVFGKWDIKGGTETHLTFLGTLKTTQGKTYKIMNSTWIWGLSRRATNRILIFNKKNQYLGNYYVTLNTDLPTKLASRILIFQNTNLDCDKKTASKISFKNGLPKTFFRKCKNNSGDFYSFDATN
ncbi:hypothetical protein [Chryseobacterium sp. JUb7]|uniref:hypothetical protein n=1 Tax=Chryseobacterium sp. JUb7 TaxID=2940599 RepID=UPI00216920FB|nr:hypothetical protein [Chryseobacterium sp. JUb7]MCS3532201.1 hypothetical protein [Chryseobacterium sp. JUb7]